MCAVVEKNADQQLPKEAHGNEGKNEAKGSRLTFIRVRAATKTLK